MATLYTYKSSNSLKTWSLMGVFLVFVVAIGYFVSTYYGRTEILYIAVIFSVLMNITGYWYGDKIALGLAGAKEIDPVKNPTDLELKRVVDNLAITAGLPSPKIYIINDEAPNAFATGRNPAHSSIAVTSGLLQTLEKNELEGVVAHEMAHIGNKDTLIATIVVVLVGFISILADMFTRSTFFGNNRGGNSESKGNPILMIIGMVLIILSPIVAQLIQLAISRKREFMADATGALMTRYPEGLARALEKISAYKEPMQKISNATSHLYIANPLGGGVIKGLGKLFSTHPPIEERIKALRTGGGSLLEHSSL